MFPGLNVHLPVFVVDCSAANHITETSEYPRYNSDFFLCDLVILFKLSENTRPVNSD